MAIATPDRVTEAVAVKRYGPPEGIGTASLELTITRPEVEWLHAMLGVGEQVPLYTGAFPRPFTQLVYIVLGQQNQPALVAQFQLGEQFKQQNPHGIGPNEVLQYLLKRYPQSKHAPEQGRFVVAKGNQIHGFIARVDENRIVIQRGGNAGDTNLPENAPISGLHSLVDDFSLLVQRYVGAVWKTAEDTAQNQMQLVLSTTDSPSAQAIRRYHATDAIITPRFLTLPRRLGFDDIGGYLRARRMIKALVVDATDPDRSISYGTDPFINKWALVWGNEGAGKSLFPKALFHAMDGVLNADYYVEMAQMQVRTKSVEEARKAAKEDQARLAELEEIRQALEREKLAVQGKRIGVEYHRLMLDQLFTKYDRLAPEVLRTVFTHVRNNERNGKHTLVHLDAMEELIPPFRRPNGGIVIMPSEAEYRHVTGRINDTVEVITDFGRVLGPHSRFVIVYGESREPRDRLPGEATGPFRRNELLGPHTTEEDIMEVLRIVIMTTQAKAARAKPPRPDPFVPGILDRLGPLAPHARGLLGGEMQRGMVNLANRHKAEDKQYQVYRDEELAEELDAKRREKQADGVLREPVGIRPFPKI